MPAKSKAVSKEDRLSQVDLARAMRKTTRQVQRWIELGMPTHGRGRTKWHVLAECVEWYVEYRIQGQRPTSLADAKERREAAEAQRAELKLARERAEVVPIEEYEQELNVVTSNLAAALKSLPSRLAPQLVGLKSIAKVQAVLGPAVRELMDSLSKSSSRLPDPDDAKPSKAKARKGRVA